MIVKIPCIVVSRRDNPFAIIIFIPKEAGVFISPGNELLGMQVTAIKNQKNDNGTPVFYNPQNKFFVN